MPLQIFCAATTTWGDTPIPCQKKPGHDGLHRFKIEWTDPPKGGGGEEAGVREPRRPKPDSGVLKAEATL